MWGSKLVRDWDERRVRYLLALFFLVLAVPAVALVAEAYRQLRWEAFHRAQSSAEEIAGRIDAELRSAVAAEEARSFGDYAFLVVQGGDAAGSVRRSALSAFPVTSAVPGVVGYFQVDAAGRLTTPLLPESGVDPSAYGVAEDERRARLAVEETIGEVLAQNHLVQRSANDAAMSTAPTASAPASAPTASAAASAPSASAPASASTASAPASAPTAAAPAPSTQESTRSASLRAPTLARRAAVSEPPQAAFDRLKSSSASDFRQALVAESTDQVAGERPETPRRAEELAAVESLDQRASAAQVAAADSDAARGAVRTTRTEQSLVPEPKASPAAQKQTPEPGGEFRIRIFESELDPFEVGRLDSGQLVMFRNVWRDGQRYIQGALIDPERFVTGAVGRALDASSLAGVADLAIAYTGTVLGAVRSNARDGRALAYPSSSLVYRSRLSPPFGDLELVFSADALPLASGGVLLGWVSVTLAAVLSAGFFFMYRFAVGQIRLRRQQHDFVSAVSHELKTPLTSIRMYGEMLKAGWADDARKQAYYDYIHGESERLSRLIENVLELARVTHQAPQFDLKRVTAAELLDLVCSKIGTQVERAGFRLEVRNEAEPRAEVLVDPDAFTQIVINLVDNALKFSRGAERKVVEIACRHERSGEILFTVRDYGPGIPKGQLKKIFELFYRPMNELTRETVGTGIGLALVRQLAMAMEGRIEVRNCDPGAEFRISFHS